MLFAETVSVPGIMFSTMESKLKQIQEENQMALRPVPSQQPTTRPSNVWNIFSLAIVVTDSPIDR